MDIGFRADRIGDARLGALSAESAVDVASMASIQADVHSSGWFSLGVYILAAEWKAQGLGRAKKRQRMNQMSVCLRFRCNKISLKKYMCDFQNG